MGQPGARLLFAGRREESTRQASVWSACIRTRILNLSVESVYEAFDGMPVVRRYSRVTNEGILARGHRVFEFGDAPWTCGPTRLRT